MRTVSLPHIPELADVMAGLTLLPSEGGRETRPNVRLVPTSDGFDEGGNVERMLHLEVAFSNETKLSFERFLDRVSRELESRGHERSASFSLLVVAISLLRPGSPSDRVNNLNKTLETIKEADLSLYFVSSIKLPEFYSYDIPPFKLGPLRSDKLKWNSEKAGSDFYGRYRGQLQGKWAIERLSQRHGPRHRLP